MPALSDRIENVLNEGRMLLLGGQVLLGFTYRICFEAAFEKLPTSAQYIELAALFLVTIGLAALIWPVTFHRIAEHGWQTQRIHEFTTSVLDWALLPFGISLGLSFYPVCVAMRIPHPAIITTIASATTLFAWYGSITLRREPRKRERMRPKLQKEEQQQHDDLSERIKKVLIECRMALPGTQAFLGFQFAIVFVDGFEKMPRTLQYAHFASMIAMSVALLLLITPAAYHRLAEAGEDTERFHKVASRLLLTSMVFLAPGMSADLFVVLAKVTKSMSFAAALAGALLFLSYVTWFVFSWLRRRTW